MVCNKILRNRFKRILFFHIFTCKTDEEHRKLDELFGLEDETEDLATVARHERMVLALRMKEHKDEFTGMIKLSVLLEDLISLLLILQEKMHLLQRNRWFVLKSILGKVTVT